jgi:hypothetical protein
MSSNRLRYDKCTYKQDLMQSVAPIDYMLDPLRYEHKNKCRMELGVVGGTAVSHITGNLVDLENDLRGQTRPVTRCPTYQYAPPKNNVLESQEYIKPVQHPKIDLTPKHLPACQMIHYQEVPNVPSTMKAGCNDKA